MSDAAADVAPSAAASGKHILSALVLNQPGVLDQISGMLASRAFNIDSLAVGATENPRFARMTFVVDGDGKTLAQVRKQLEKIVTVVKVLDYAGQETVERDLMLIKVSVPFETPLTRVKDIVEVFRGKIVHVASDHVMIEISGSESKIDAFIDVVRPIGILEMVRTGRIALLRNESMAAEEPPAPAKPVPHPTVA